MNAELGQGDTAEPALEAKDLVKHFPIHRGIVVKRAVGHVQAVDGVDLKLYPGQTLGVVGESGCGKSTLAKLLVGLETPTSGSIKIQGEEIAGLSARRMRPYRRNIQLVFQDPYTSLNPRLTVGDIVGEPFEIHPDVIPKFQRADEVKSLLDMVGLSPDHVNRYPHQFSGGQRQRIGIARALALRPQVLVCDEPVSALDVSIQGQVINLLQQLQQELGLAYVFIAHDLSVVRHIADEVAVMYLGKVVERGTGSEIYDHPRHPYTQALLSAVPVPDPELRGHREEIVLHGDVPSPINPPSGCRFRTRCWKATDHCAEAVPPLEAGESGPRPPGPDDPEQREDGTRPPAHDPNRSERDTHLAACFYAEERDVTHAVK